MKKIILFCISVNLITLLLFIPAAGADQSPEDSPPAFELSAGISFMPAVWWKFRSPFYPLIGDDNEHIRYDMDRTAFSSYEANFRIPAIGITAGAFVNVDDNAIGRVDRILGYLGYKSLILRLSKGELKGSFTWDGPMAAGMETDVDFDYEMTNYDLIYFLDFSGKENSDFAARWFYIGLGYTEFTVPLEIKCLLTESDKTNQYYGNFVYDSSYKISTYDFLFGFDTVTAALRGGMKKIIFPGGWTIWGSAQDRIGFGQGVMSREAETWAENVNPGRSVVSREVIVSYLENNSTLGIAWLPPFLNGKLAIALGYNLTFASATSMNGAADDNTDIGYDSDFNFFHHGIVFRISGVW